MLVRCRIPLLSVGKIRKSELWRNSSASPSSGFDCCPVCGGDIGFRTSEIRKLRLARLDAADVAWPVVKSIASCVAHGAGAGGRVRPEILSPVRLVRLNRPLTHS